MNDIVTNWSPVGYLTYKRTYARLLDPDLGPDSPTEEWEDTIERILDACKYQIKVGFTEDEEDRLREYMLKLKGSVAGRMLWQLGTHTVSRYGLASLQNCAFTVVDDPIKPFCWCMDMLALGSGVGFNIQRENVDKLPLVKTWFRAPKCFDDGGADFIVPDSREGWVQLLGKTLKAAFLSATPNKGTFTYSTQIIRSKGKVIKGFGGLASGAEELVKGIDKIAKVLEKRRGRKIRPIDALDIMNIIGAIIVSGNVRRCLPAGTMVHTSGGLKPIETIEKGDKVLTDSGYKNVLNTFDQGKQFTVNIKTQDGVLECTPNHRVAVMTGIDNFEWKEAGLLSSDDRLCTTRTPIDNFVTELPSFEGLKIPELDADLAWLIGAIHGNGYVYLGTKNSGASVNLEFNANDVEEREKAAQQLSRFGVNPKIRKTDGQYSFKVTAYSKILAEYFYCYVKQPKISITIPDFILNGSYNVRLGYVAGVLDTDGSVNHTPVRLCSSIYKEYLIQLQQLMYSLGLETRFETDAPSKNPRKQNMYALNIISDFVKTVIEDSGQLCKVLRRGNRDNYGNTYIQEWLYPYHIRNPSSGGGKNREIAVRRFSEETGIFPKLIPTKVLDVCDGRIVNTYDIEVEDNHCFFANGYLVHNSAQIALFDPDDLECLLAKRWDLGNIPSHRAMSNNSVICNNLDDLHEFFWDTYNGNSEPLGLINLELSKKCGRLGETQYPDPNIQGYNP